MSPRSGACPLCGIESRTSVSPALRHCKGCRVVYNTSFRGESYGKEYFTDDYRSQYGRTYEEDFDTIYRLAGGRISRILARKKGQADPRYLSILDIGSALGFFLKCAKDRGFRGVTGIEISGYASGFCRDRFGIETINSPFPAGPPEKPYDIITAWYFIEHNEFPGTILARIYGMLGNDGLFAFSTPSIRGPQFMFRRRQWVTAHPEDHRIDFSPGAVRRLLKKIGFKKVWIVPAGFHPERIVPEGSVFFRPFCFLYGAFVKLAAFSDTMEVYAAK